MALAEQGKKSVILCVTKQLQDQYERDFGDQILVLKGKANYPCMLGLADNTEAADDNDLCRTCTVKNVCGYWKDIKATETAPIVVTNYAAYWFHRQNGKYLNDIDTLVMDEGHEFENVIFNMLDTQMTGKDAVHLGIDLPSDLNMIKWEDAMDRAECQDPIHLQKADSDPFFSCRIENKKYQIRAAIHDIEDGHRWVIDPIENKWVGGWLWRPLWVKPHWTKKLTVGVKRLVISSATPYTLDKYKRLLGYKEGRTVKMPSFFKPWYRPFYIIPAVKVDRKMSAGDIQNLCSLIERTLEKYPDKKGLIHTVSYDLRDKIMRGVNSSRLITHDSQNKQFVLESFKKSSEGLILVSPSVHTGVDLPYDLCRVQIIAKLPYPNLGDSRISARKEEFPNSYQEEIANTLMQMYGRGMRAIDDQCDTYIFDIWADRFLKNNENLFPDYVKDAFYRTTL